MNNVLVSSFDKLEQRKKLIFIKIYFFKNLIGQIKVDWSDKLLIGQIKVDWSDKNSLVR